MTEHANLDDYHWLTGETAAEALNEIAASEAPLHSWVKRLRKTLSQNCTHLLLEQVELRSRAKAKFAQADQMFFTRVALEQATDQWIAEYKATRFRNCNRVTDLCCGIGGDLMALASGRTATAIDLDPITLHFAETNVAAVLGNHTAEQIGFIADDVSSFQPTDNCTAWHLDPDRRPQGERTSHIEFGSPSLGAIEKLLREVPNAAIKLAPAAAVPEPWAVNCECEWISRGGECRQQVAWLGDLVNATGKHTATVLYHTHDNLHSQVTSFTGTPNQTIPMASELGEFILEPDSSILAAHLLGEFATQHHLQAISPGIAYLTSDQPPVHPLVTSFRVLDELPLDRRKLAGYFSDRQIGNLEIKKRGVDIAPEELRKSLKLRGNNSSTLILTPLGGQNRAIVVERVAV